jgi:sugar phosphate isomerase/epimerase
MGEVYGCAGGTAKAVVLKLLAKCRELIAKVNSSFYNEASVISFSSLQATELSTYMTFIHPTRRQMLTAAASLTTLPALADDSTANKPGAFRFCLNTSTLMGQKLDIIELIEIASKAGYQAIEPWMGELDELVKKGGNPKDLAKRLSDRGLTVEDVIAFFEWSVDDDEKRKKGMEEARRSMDLIAKIEGKRIAAPPLGATQQADLTLNKVAERYRQLLELGDKAGVVPQVEFWGPSRALSRLSEAAFVAVESGHPKACILADVYHLYKGGSDLNGLRLLSRDALHVIHFNDYPADPPRKDIADAQRVYPGDGIAPLKTILGILRDIGFNGVLSLELFNRDYWKLDAQEVAKTGLEKMKKAVKDSLTSPAKP